MKTHLINFERCLKSILIPIIFIGFESCETYQFVTLSSDLPQDAGNKFVYENDTIKIQYSFAGESCPITIDIYNKSEQPIHIDWSQSSIIFDDQSFSLCPDLSNMTDDISQPVDDNEEIFSFVGNEMDETDSRNQFSFIPPRSNLKVTPMNLVNEWLPTSKTDSITKSLQFRPEGHISIKSHKFSVSQSPLYFRCYLTYLNQTEKGNPKHVDHQFWASDIYKSQAMPENNIPAQYHVSKTTVFGGFMYTIGFLALTISTLYLASIPE